MNQQDDRREAPTEQIGASSYTEYPKTASMPSPSPRLRSQGTIALALVVLSALAGVWMSATSTRDFAHHLDGQVHALVCSVVPGARAELGSSGCKDAMLSPYSSIWRDRLWGGVPVALGGMGVFVFLAALALSLLFSSGRSRRDVGYLLLAATLPVLTSFVFGWLSAERVGSFCVVCVGTYVASGAIWVFALLAYLRSHPGEGPWAWGRLGLWTVEGGVIVVALTWMWMAWAPQERPSVQAGCGTLVAQDKPGVLLPLSRHKDGIKSLLVLDPLCPACRAFDRRLKISGLDAQLSIDLLLFPLDSHCNWMVKSSLHPGACALSEAVFCASDRAREVLDWAFEEQERLLALGKQDDKALRAEISRRFPTIGRCVGSSKARAKVNKALRYAVTNALPVLSPQLFVDGVRLCEENTDLGLDYTLGEMLKSARAGPAEAALSGQERGAGSGDAPNSAGGRP